MKLTIKPGPITIQKLDTKALENYVCPICEHPHKPWETEHHDSEPDLNCEVCKAKQDA